MEDKYLAFAIAQRFTMMEAEIEAFRNALKLHWNHAKPWEPLVDKGKDQILNLEITQQRYAQLQSAFAAASNDGSLIPTLHDQLLHRVKI